MYINTDYSIINVLLQEFKNNIGHDDFEVYVFPQLWGSTALGYGGIGGSAMTSAHTIVLFAINENVARVYFGGRRLAYEIKNPNELFWDDLFKQNLVEISRHSKYVRK